MKKLLLLVLLLFVLGCSTANNYTLDLKMDTTSSGAARLTQATLTVENGKVVEGWQKYSYSGTMGNKYSYECILDLDTETWYYDSGEICDEIGNFLWDLPLTHAKIQQKINSGEYILNDGTNYHNIMAYEIVTY
jgi:hypothetical protein